MEAVPLLLLSLMSFQRRDDHGSGPSVMQSEHVEAEPWVPEEASPRQPESCN